MPNQFHYVKSDHKMADNDESSSRRQNGRHWQTLSHFGMFLSASMNAAVFQGKDYSDDLHSIRSTAEKPTVRNCSTCPFENKKISGVSQICWQTSPCERLSLVNDEEAIRFSTAKVHVFSDSVLCLGRVPQFPQSNDDWETTLQWFLNSKPYRESDRIDGELMDFAWKIYPGFTTLQILFEIQKLMN